ncbi:type II secretion system F family protein [Agromyces mariniharenae]|uniref:Type II secretion system protein F n=1 Tax=Agromyces mariniharenae TaxID=2604423 RepID=A0A5S4V7C7_9MICO|nr:type II secretion system F family protein [Agromyces mariniharenae]TYL53191.1 type II secretion system protein F [Agromyces mariniharenae]
MSPGILIAGLSVCLLAALVILFFVIAPPPPRVARDRRRAPGVEHVSTLTKVTQRTTAVIDSTFTKQRARLFGAEELELAGIKSEPSSFVLIVGSAASIAALVGALLGWASGSAIILALLFALLTPIVAKLVVILRTSRRRSKFSDQIDDTVQLIAGGLRAGHGLSRTVAAVASEAEAPMSEELARAVNETRLGRNLAEALAVAAHRMRSDDFEWVAQAIAINMETGGNLAEVLDQVGKTIRERNEIRRQVSALSAEGRLSGIILVALPVGVFLFLSITQPTLIAGFFNNIIGIIAMIVAIILLIVGSFWTAASVKVKF